MHPPFTHGGYTAWVAPADDDKVLKIGWPHEEAEFEADGLAVWDGDGIIRLVRHDRERWALLLERCTPGHGLGTEWSDATVELGCSMVTRLWREVDGGPFDTVAAMCSRWAEVSRERAARLAHGMDPGVVALGIELLDRLPRDERVLLHQDLHPGNVLAAGREPWLVIDPKPIVGDRGFDTVQLVRQGVHDEVGQRARLAQVADLTGVDAEHLGRWALARSVESALWHVERGDAHRGWVQEVALLGAVVR